MNHYISFKTYFSGEIKTVYFRSEKREHLYVFLCINWVLRVIYLKWKQNFFLWESNFKIFKDSESLGGEGEESSCNMLQYTEDQSQNTEVSDTSTNSVESVSDPSKSNVQLMEGKCDLQVSDHTGKRVESTAQSIPTLSKSSDKHFRCNMSFNPRSISSWEILTLYRGLFWPQNVLFELIWNMKLYW